MCSFNTDLIMKQVLSGELMKVYLNRLNETGSGPSCRHTHLAGGSRERSRMIEFGVP